MRVRDARERRPVSQRAAVRLSLPPAFKEPLLGPRPAERFLVPPSRPRWPAEGDVVSRFGPRFPDDERRRVPSTRPRARWPHLGDVAPRVCCGSCVFSLTFRPSCILGESLVCSVHWEKRPVHAPDSIFVEKKYLILMFPTFHFFPFQSFFASCLKDGDGWPRPPTFSSGTFISPFFTFSLRALWN